MPTGLSFDPRQCIAHLMVRKKRCTVAVLHHVGGLMGQHHPNLPRIILEIVGAQKQGVPGSMKRPEQRFRTILGHHRVRARSPNQSGIAADAIPCPPWRGLDGGSQQRQHERHSDWQPT